MVYRSVSWVTIASQQFHACNILDINYHGVKPRAGADAVLAATAGKINRSNGLARPADFLAPPTGPRSKRADRCVRAFRQNGGDRCEPRRGSTESIRHHPDRARDRARDRGTARRDCDAQLRRLDRRISGDELRARPCREHEHGAQRGDQARHSGQCVQVGEPPAVRVGRRLGAGLRRPCRRRSRWTDRPRRVGVTDRRGRPAPDNRERQSARSPITCRTQAWARRDC